MKWIFSFILMAFITLEVVAQAPEKMSYQGVIRNSTNQLVNASDVGVKILIKHGSANGSTVYEESHSAKTNANGLVSFQIGTGKRIIGEFAKINWSQGPYFVESRVDPSGGKNYSISGISQILSVPYALHAKSAENFTGTISGSQILDLEFEVNGDNPTFKGWDKDTSDDFSGDYLDLINLPDFYTKEEIDKLFVDVNVDGGLAQTLNWNNDRLSISGGNSIILTNWDTDVTDDFSGDYQDLKNQPKLFSGNYKDLFDLPELYNRHEINALLANIETSGDIPQMLELNGEKLTISNGNSISFEKWDTNADDDFSGKFNDLQDKPELYNKSEIDNLISGIEATGSVPQNLNLEQATLSISGGNSISFEKWDTNAEDDFSGKFSDLLDKPELYNKLEIDNLISGIETTGSVPQNLNLDQATLSISGGNSISFEKWDTNAEDDFSGDYSDLKNAPALFSGKFKDLNEVPELYTKNQVDSLVVNLSGGTSVVQSLNLENTELSISGGNSISFQNWDTNVSDDFSGNYSDLKNAPALFSGNYIDLENTPALFSGKFKDLTEVPELYTKNQVDSLVVNLDGGNGVVQSLNLEGEKLSISGGNSISFENWDTDASDDFSGNYSDLKNTPELFSGNYSDLINAPVLFSGNFTDLKNTPTLFSGKFKDLIEMPELYTKSQVDSLVVNLDGGNGVVQSLILEGEKLSISGGNSISFENWDTDASDDFSGNYSDLKNAPELFSGKFKDLIEMPELYTKSQVDSLVVNLDGGNDVVQSLNLEGEKLSISGGNSISFENWDTDASDDFSGNYSDLKNAPELFSGNFTDLKNTPTLFSGKFIDLIEMPELYTKSQVDSLVVNLDGGSGVVQSLILEGKKLSISGGNSISFENWDTDATDDFDGEYVNLKNAPALFSGNYIDLINIPSIYTKTQVDSLVVNLDGGGSGTQSLNLEGEKLSISGGNSISFSNWDTDATDDFDGEYVNLKNVPKMYTQVEVDSIKNEILKTVEASYSKKAKIFPMTSSRNIISTDIGNTIACTVSATLSIPSGFSAMEVGDVINLEVQGTTLTLQGSGVIVNGVDSGNATIGNDKAYTGGILRKTGTNTYIVL